MNAPNFSQFAAQVPQPAPNAAQPWGQPPAGPAPQPVQAQPVAGGFATPAPAAWGQPPQGQAPQSPPPGYQGTSTQPGPHGYGGPQGQPAPYQQQSNDAPVFGAGAFGGVALNADRFDDLIVNHEYILEVGDSWINKGFKGMGWKIELKVAKNLTPGGSPEGTESGMYQYLNPSDQVQSGKANGAVLALVMAALGHEHEAQFKAAYPNFGEIMYAMQRKDAQLSQTIPPNPLKGRFVKCRTFVQANKKEPHKPYVGMFFTPAQ